MNLAKWLEQPHSLAEQLEVMLSICKSVVGSHQGGSAAGVALAPARMEVDSGGSLHLMGGSIGTPTEYAAPELGEGDDPTPSADVFAVGVIYYEILTGRHPFARAGGFDRDIDPTPLRDKRSDLPSDVADAIQACLDKDPDWRPKDLDYLLSVLEKAATEGSKPSASRTPTIKPTVKRGTMRPQMKPGSNPPQVQRSADAAADGPPADDDACYRSPPGRERRDRKQHRVRAGRPARAGSGWRRCLLRSAVSGGDRRGATNGRRADRLESGGRDAGADTTSGSANGPSHSTPLPPRRRLRIPRRRRRRHRFQSLFAKRSQSRLRPPLRFRARRRRRRPRPPRPPRRRPHLQSPP